MILKSSILQIFTSFSACIYQQNIHLICVLILYMSYDLINSMLNLLKIYYYW